MNKSGFIWAGVAKTKRSKSSRAVTKGKRPQSYSSDPFTKGTNYIRICCNYLLERFLSWVKTKTLRLFLIIFFYVCIFRTPAIISSEISCQILDQSRGKANPVDTFLGAFTRAWRQLNVQVFTSNFNCINWTMSGIKIPKIWKDTWLYEAVVKSISLTAFGQTQL